MRSRHGNHGRSRSNTWQVTFSLAVLLILLLLATFCMAQQPSSDPLQLPQEPGCQANEPPLGAVLLSRNLDERQNDSPGWWNHMCIYVGGGYVVESQVGQYGNGVIRTALDNYLARPYVRVVLHPNNPAIGARAAAVAATYVGRPYRRYSSLAPQLIPAIVPRLLHGTSYGQNCVSTVREAYESAVGYPLYGFRNPDDALSRGDLFNGPYEVQPVVPYRRAW